MPIHPNKSYGACSDHGRLVLLLAAAFGFFAQILNLDFLRMSRGIHAYSDLGLLLLVCLAWWAHLICHIFMPSLVFTSASLMEGTIYLVNFVFLKCTKWLLLIFYTKSIYLSFVRFSLLILLLRHLSCTMLFFCSSVLTKPHSSHGECLHSEGASWGHIVTWVSLLPSK